MLLAGVATELSFGLLVLLSSQHYTKDADGLCTRLIKPKLEEGTVAAQDEFSRSKFGVFFLLFAQKKPSCLSQACLSQLNVLYLTHRWLVYEQKGPEATAGHWKRRVRRQEVYTLHSLCDVIAGQLRVI